MNENDDIAVAIGRLVIENLVLLRRIKELEAQVKPEPAESA